ncbi:MAG: DUF4215 domain-containing protein, partial [Rhodococcus sp. (in: high G+C Gram-positive bacteria)]
MEVSTAACGNGIAELPERCDDGNLDAGDGCDAQCELEVGGVLGQCPGQPFRLGGAPGAVRTVSFAGNTETDGADTQDAPNCYFGAAKNVVYALLSDVDGSAHVDLTAGYRRSAIHVRSECSNSSYQQTCVATDAPGESELDTPVRAGEWFYVFVDSWKVGGPYTATVSVHPAACGNGRVDGNESCDDGNVSAGDGCDATCGVEAAVKDAANTCAGSVVLLGTPDANGVYRGAVASTTTGQSNKVPGCHTLYGNTNTTVGDSIFAVDVPVNGRLTAELDAPYQGQVSILAGDPCLQPPSGSSLRLGNVVACSNGIFIPYGSGTEPFVLRGIADPSAGGAVVQGQRYYVVVDTFALGSGTSAAFPGTRGAFRLNLQLTPASCGNGVLEGTEACDDGNDAPGDGCDAVCGLEDVTFRDTCATAEVLTL